LTGEEGEPVILSPISAIDGIQFGTSDKPITITQYGDLSIRGADLKEMLNINSSDGVFRVGDGSADILSQFRGDVNVGDSNTDYSLTLNGLAVSQIYNAGGSAAFNGTLDQVVQDQNIANGIISFGALSTAPPDPMGTQIELFIVHQFGVQYGHLYMFKSTRCSIFWSLTQGGNTQEIVRWNTTNLVWDTYDTSPINIPDDCISLLASSPYPQIPYQQAFTINIPGSTGAIVDCKWLYENGEYGSHTITHRINIVNYSPEQIGTFCETTGEISDVYGSGYVPTLERATDAIVKVKQCTSVNSKIMGIITKWNQFMTHGDGLCRVVDDTYTLGDILVPDETGLCRKASQEEALFCTINQIHLPRVSAKISDNAEIVAIFM
jgi:hypothetical protein